jgi:hypothetical protein
VIEVGSYKDCSIFQQFEPKGNNEIFKKAFETRDLPLTARHSGQTTHIKLQKSFAKTSLSRKGDHLFILNSEMIGAE